MEAELIYSRLQAKGVFAPESECYGTYFNVWGLEALSQGLLRKHTFKIYNYSDDGSLYRVITMKYDRSLGDFYEVYMPDENPAPYEEGTILQVVVDDVTFSFTSMALFRSWVVHWLLYSWTAKWVVSVVSSGISDTVVSMLKILYLYDSKSLMSDAPVYEDYLNLLNLLLEATKSKEEGGT